MATPVRYRPDYSQEPWNPIWNFQIGSRGTVPGHAFLLSRDINREVDQKQGSQYSNQFSEVGCWDISKGKIAWDSTF